MVRTSHRAALRHCRLRAVLMARQPVIEAAELNIRADGTDGEINLFPETETGEKLSKTVHTEGVEGKRGTPQEGGGDAAYRPVHPVPENEEIRPA